MSGGGAESGLSPGGEAALAALAGDELKQALQTIGIGEYDERVRGVICPYVYLPAVAQQTSLLLVLFAASQYGIYYYCFNLLLLFRCSFLAYVCVRSACAPTRGQRRRAGG
jgi:hypothetical protein